MIAAGSAAGCPSASCNQTVPTPLSHPERPMRQSPGRESRAVGPRLHKIGQSLGCFPGHRLPNPPVQSGARRRGVPSPRQWPAASRGRGSTFHSPAASIAASRRASFVVADQRGNRVEIAFRLNFPHSRCAAQRLQQRGSLLGRVRCRPAPGRARAAIPAAHPARRSTAARSRAARRGSLPDSSRLTSGATTRGEPAACST